MIEEVKEPVHSEQEWLEERRSYIGSSEVFELLNRAQYGRGCRTALAYRKLGVEPDYEIEEDDAILARGNILEPIAASIYEQQTGRKVRRPPMDDNHAQVRRHRQYPWAAAALDRQILAGHGGVTEPGDLEIKTRDQGPYYRVLRQGPFDGDLLQTQWSMFVTGHKWASLAVLGLFGGLPMIVDDMLRDDDLNEMFQRIGGDFAEKVWGEGAVPHPAFPATDQRCKVCVYRQTCRGEQLDEDELAELREMRKSSRQLVQIDNAALSATLNDIQLLRAEKKSLEASIDVRSEERRVGKEC